MALRICSYNVLGLDEFIVYAASYYVNAVADGTDEVRLVVKARMFAIRISAMFILDCTRFLVL